MKIKLGSVTGINIGGDLIRLRGVDGEIAHAHGENIGGSVINATDAPISHATVLREGQLPIAKPSDTGHPIAATLGAFAGAAVKKLTE